MSVPPLLHGAGRRRSPATMPGYLAGRRPPNNCEGALELDPERFVTRSHGRRAWFREARRGLDERRALEARPVARKQGSAAVAGGVARSGFVSNVRREARVAR